MNVDTIDDKDHLCFTRSHHVAIKETKTRN